MARRHRGGEQGEEEEGHSHSEKEHNTQLNFFSGCVQTFFLSFNRKYVGKKKTILYTTTVNNYNVMSDDLSKEVLDRLWENI